MTARPNFANTGGMTEKPRIGDAERLESVSIEYDSALRQSTYLNRLNVKRFHGGVETKLPAS
jgi:hypothetical protein